MKAINNYIEKAIYYLFSKKEVIYNFKKGDLWLQVINHYSNF